MRTARIVALLSACAAIACSSPPADDAEARPATPAPAPGTPDPRPVVVFLGDSLTAGDGVAGELAFPALVAAELERRGRSIRAVNAGVSGDTSAGGLRRVDWLLRQQPQLVVVELGANDGLRGLDLDATEGNLRAIVQACDAAGARVLLAGMALPPNYGEDYTARFAGLFPKLASELGVELIPFLLDGVGGVAELNQADGIHPNAAGHARIAQTVLPYIARALAGDRDGGI